MDRFLVAESDPPEGHERNGQIWMTFFNECVIQIIDSQKSLK